VIEYCNATRYITSHNERMTFAIFRPQCAIYDTSSNLYLSLRREHLALSPCTN
jgi:hypothetical protein